MEAKIVGGLMCLVGVITCTLATMANYKMEYLEKCNAIKLNKKFILVFKQPPKTFTLLENDNIVLEDIINFRDTTVKTYIVCKQQYYILGKWKNKLICLDKDITCSKKTTIIFQQLESDAELFKKISFDD